MRIAIAASLILLATATPAQEVDSAKVRRAAEDAVATQDWDTAVASFRKLTELKPEDGPAWHMLGYSLHAQGKLDEALEIHIKATEFPSVAPTASYNAACVYALKGKKGKALDWLEKAAERGFTGLAHMANDPDMDGLRDDPRYTKIIEKIKQGAGDAGHMQVFSGTFDRKLTRIVLFSDNSSAGGVTIGYGQPEWREKYEEMIESKKGQDRRWRFGRDAWTTLDSNVALEINGTKVPAGVYYLTVERREGGEFVMACIEPAKAHKGKLDPYVAHMTTGGIEVTLKHERTDEIEDRLRIDLKANQGKPGEGKLVVRFGPHKLYAPLSMKIGGSYEK